MKETVDRLYHDRHLDREGYKRILSASGPEVREYAASLARGVAADNFGKAVYARGLIEFTNYCRNNCYYCGIRRSNRNIGRYRLSVPQILECCRLGDSFGLKTFVLQGGDDAGVSDAAMAELIRAIRREFPHHAITLSVGERNKEAFRSFFAAGANRYLLRHETADATHYRHLHPAGMSFGNRMHSLKALKETGYQTGAGMMVGSPGQSVDTLAEDLLFLEYLRPEMIGIGPFIPQHDTPFASQPAGSVELTLLLISILRIMFPHALIPATTALASLNADGYQRGILAGANVVMFNITPREYRGSYAIYDHKKAAAQHAGEEYAELAGQIESIGYHLSCDRGDYKS